MSVWETSQSIANKGVKEFFNNPKRWPDPTRGLVKRIDVLACESLLITRMEMWTLAAAVWAYGVFIPQPTEIARKILTGGYKCGFYSKRSIKSPLDIIWRDGRTSKTLGQMLRPATTGLWAMWAASSAYDALATWQTLAYKIDACDADGNETILAFGHAPFHLGDNSGAPAFYLVQYDPQERGNEANGDVFADYKVAYNAYWFGYIRAASVAVHDIKVGWSLNGVQFTQTDYGSIGPGEEVVVEASLTGVVDFMLVQPYFECRVDDAAIFMGDVFCEKLIVKAVPTSEEERPAGPLFGPDVPKNYALCDEVYEYVNNWTATGVG